MRFWTTLGALAAAALPCAAARAASPVILRGLAARVVVIPEARADTAVTIVAKNPQLPVRINHFFGRLIISGDVGHHVHGCPMLTAGQAVEVRGRGMIPVDSLPRLIIRVPLQAHISADEAVFGTIGRTDSLDLANRGCGDWVIGNVKGHLRLNETGSGVAHAGAAGSADLSVAGLGGIDTRDIGGELSIVSASAGNIGVSAVTGPLNVRIAGSGDIKIPAGAVTVMTAAIAGSGNVRFGGVAQSLNASIIGPGDVRVAKVTGAVTKRLFGRGQVWIGPFRSAAASGGAATR